MTNFLRIACAVALAVAGLSAVAEPKGPEYAVVTSAEDGTGLGGGKITLRDAVGAMADPAFTNAAGARVITFASGMTVKLADSLVIGEGASPFTVDGGADDASVTITSATGCRLIDHRGQGLSLCNLMFSGGTSTGAGGAIYAAGPAAVTNQTLSVSNCTFAANAASDGGAIAAESNTVALVQCCTFYENVATNVAGAVRTAGRLTAVNSTFYGNQASGSGASALAVSAGGELLVAKCTVAAGLGARGGLHVAAGATATVCDSFLIFNVLSKDDESLADVVNDGALALYGTGLSAAPTGSGTTTAGTGNDFSVDAETLLPRSCERLTVVNGVTNLALAVAYCTAATNGAGTLWFDAAWTNVAVGSADAPTTALCGSADLATIRLANDQTGPEDRPARGALRHDFVNVIRFQVDGQTKHVVEAICGSSEVPDAPAVQRAGGVLKGWYTQPGGAGVCLWNEKGEPDRTKLPKVPYEPLVVHAFFESSDEAYTVSDGGDGTGEGGKATLRMLVQAMADHPEWAGEHGRRVITIPASVGTVSLASALQVTNAVPFVIRGAWDGTNAVTIKAQSQGYRLFLLKNAGMGFENLTFQDAQSREKGEETGGGAIWAAETCELTVSNCAFRSNSAVLAGGAVRLMRQGTFERCSFDGNWTTEDGGHGAAVSVDGDGAATFRNCSFTRNSPSGLSCPGGAVYVSNGERCAFEGCTFAGNAASEAGAVAVRSGVPSFTGCLAVSNSPTASTSSALTNLPGEVLADGGRAFDLTVGGAHHASVRPALCEAVTNAPGATGGIDLLGHAALVPGLGAVRGEYGIRLDLDPGEGGRVLDDVNHIWGVCGRSCVGLSVPRAERTGATFLGWWTGPNRTGERCFDENGDPIATTVLPLAEQLTLYAGWRMGLDGLKVTTAKDTTGVAGQVSLRDALAKIAANAADIGEGEDVTVTFELPENAVISLASPLAIPTNAPPFTIDGSNGVTAVTLAAAADGLDELIAANGRKLTLRNLMFRGAACRTATLVSTNGALTVENCAFDVSGCPVSATGANLILRDASFANVSAPLVCHAQANTVVNCTVLGTASPRLDFSNDSVLLKCTLPDANWAGSVTDVDVITNSTLLAETNVMTRCSGVDQVWRPALNEFSLTYDSVQIWHDADWSNIAGEQLGDRWREIRGSRARATQKLDTDQLGAVQQHNSKGAVRSRVAVRFDLDANGGTVEPTNVVAFCGETPDPMPVPRREHYTFVGWLKLDGEQAFGPDGKPIEDFKAPWKGTETLTARWSVMPDMLIVSDETEFQAALNALADPQNDFRDRTITLTQDISLTRTLTIAEGTSPFAIDGQGKTIDGGNKVQLIDHQGKGLILRNLTLTGGDSVKGGALASSKGTLRAENCAFVNNKAKFGGALCLEASLNLLLDCSFVGNESREGGNAIYLYEPRGGGRTTAVMIHSTVVEKTSDYISQMSTIYANSGGGGSFSALACSFVGSGNTNYVGNLLGVGSIESVTLAGCAFASHPDSLGTDVGWHYAPSAVNADRCTFLKVDLQGHWRDCCKTSVENIFANRTDPKARTAKGVTHTYYPPALSGQMTGGIWVWHDPNWENIAYSASPTRNSSEMRAIVGDPAACTLLKSTDQVGLTFYTSLLFRGAVTAIAADELGLEVTTPEDTVVPGDGLISLREAILAAESGQLDPGRDGRYTITFADSLFAASNAVTVAFNCTNETGLVKPTVDLVIQGRTDDRSVALDVRNNQPAPSFQIDPGVRFALRNLTVGYTCVKPGNVFTNGLVRSEGELEITDCLFEKCRQWHSAPMVVSDGGTAVVERSSFVGDPKANETDIVGGGTLNVNGGNMRVIDCTFADFNMLSGANGTWGVVEGMSSTGSKSLLSVVNCTFTGNRTNLGCVYAGWAGTEASVLNCIFNDNKNGAGTARDVYVDGAWLRVRGCVYSAIVKPNAGGSTTMLVAPEVDKCTRETSADNIFAGPLKRFSKDGVLRAYRAPKLFGPADRNGFYVWHDAAWTNVAITAKYVNQTDKTNVVGTAKGLAKTLAGRYDVVCRDALEGINVQLGASKDRRATMGSYTTPLDGEAGETGELVVTTPVDDGTSEHDAYDGWLSLREAVDFANTHPYWRDTNGNCRVRFADGLFELAKGQTIASRMRQMEVTAFTNGTLCIVGPASAGLASNDLRSVTLDGQGRHRLFYVAPGNSLSLANLNFTNAVSQKAGLCQTYAGGAIDNKGRIEVQNCAFRDCRTFQNTNNLAGAALGRAYGGAICTETGGTSVVERCTFQGCQATAGGAVCTVEGGDTVMAGSTFADNLAIRTGTVETGRGGAVCALDEALRTVLVNCTLTRNLAQDAGGAIAAGRTTDANGRLTPALYLLDSIVLGNGATVDATTGDICLEGKATLAHCWLGRRNAGDLDEQWTDDAVQTGKVPSDVFKLYTTDGVALETVALCRGAWQTFFPLNDGVETGAAFAWTYGGWANVGYSTVKGDMRNQSVLYVRERNDEIKLKTHGERMMVQQLGEQSLNRALLGAVEKYEPPEKPVPDPNVDPLCVTNGSFKSFCDVLDYAATHTGDPSLASNGCLTITFAENFTIDIASNLTLSAFTSPKLRIVGPVTFTGMRGSDSAYRPFFVTEGNSLVLENVNFVNCLATDGFGGAICLEGATLAASNVTFSACKAYSADDGIGFGGAVAALYGSTVVFEDCAFTGDTQSVVEGKYVYRYESTATFINCSFAGSADERLQTEVVDWLNALLIKPDKRKTYFSTVAEALAQCHRGDTLVLLNPDGPTEAQVREKLPTGVTLKVYADENVEEALEFVQTMADDANAAFVAKSEPWYTATVRETDGLVVMSVGLNDQAKPGIGGDGEVDFNAADGTAVSVWPTNVKPGLVYGLGRSESPTGPFAVEEDGWVRADANGTLPRALTAPKGDGAGYFYRVIVRD